MTQAYALTQSPVTIRRTLDNTYIPTTAGNKDYDDYLLWAGAGGVPDPFVALEVIPTSVTLRQARLALLASGKLDAVNAAVAAAPRAAQISWDSAQTVDRSDDLTKALAIQLGLSDADMDALFKLASTL